MENKFVVIKQDGNKHEDWTYHCTNKDGIFSQMMIVTDNDVEISQYVSEWAATASIGERMHFREGVVEVVEGDTNMYTSKNGFKFNSQDKANEYEKFCTQCFGGCKDLNDVPDMACKTCGINKECIELCKGLGNDKDKETSFENKELSVEEIHKILSDLIDNEEMLCESDIDILDYLRDSGITLDDLKFFADNDFYLWVCKTIVEYGYNPWEE